MARNGKTLLDKALDLAEEHPRWSGCFFLVSAITGLSLCFLAPAPIGSPLYFLAMSLSLASPFIGMYGLMGAVIRHERQHHFAMARDLMNFRDMHPDEFEGVVAVAYREQAYRVRHIGGPGDGGVDLLLTKDGLQVAVQCKQWHNWKVGIRNMREFQGAMADFPKVNYGIFVTCGFVSEPARAYAKRRGIDVVDREALVELLKGSESAQSQVVETEITNFIDPSPPCPKCDAGMVIRLGKKGNYRDRRLWQCSSYPDCFGFLEVEAEAA